MEGLNTAYAMATEESSISYPAIQASEYRPRTAKDKVRLCLGEDSFNMLAEEYLASLGGEPETAVFGEEQVPIFLLPEACRFVVLGIPKLFAVGKIDGKVDFLKKGEKLKEAGKVTVTRLPLLIQLPSGELVMDGDRPQIFTLKLKSSKTKLLSGDNRDPEYRSLQDLQNGLQKHYKVRRQSLLHLVSVGLVAQPEKFSNGVDSSWGVMFNLVGGARPLPEAQQKMVFDLIQDPEVQDLLSDPFGLKRMAVEEPQGIPAPTYSVDTLVQPGGEDYPPFRAYETMLGRAEDAAGCLEARNWALRSGIPAEHVDIAYRAAVGRFGVGALDPEDVPF